MNLTALDRRVRPKGSADSLAQRLGAVNNKHAAHGGIEPAFDQIVDQRLDHGGVLGCALHQPERMVVAVGVDAERGDKRCKQAEDRNHQTR
jgi:hypothetical protein